VSREQFDQMTARQRSALVRFARHLGAQEPADLVHDTIVRLVDAGAYERYAFEPDATRIPTWMRKALKFTIWAGWAKTGRRARLLREDLDEREHVREAFVAVSGGDGTEGGFQADGERELSVPQVEGLGRLVREEEELERDALREALAAELARIELATATGMRLVLGDGQTWQQAGEATGVPAEALRKRVARAIPAIREHLVRVQDVAHVVIRGQENDLPEEKR
jgi:RNA polymerase sigma factor (sigma-70 family)